MLTLTLQKWDSSVTVTVSEYFFVTFYNIGPLTKVIGWHNHEVWWNQKLSKFVFRWSEVQEKSVQHISFKNYNDESVIN